MRRSRGQTKKVWNWRKKVLDKATRNSVCLQQKTPRNSVQADQAGKENAMTNNEIIFETVRNTFTPAQLAELVQATYTAEQIAARRAAEAASAPRRPDLSRAARAPEENDGEKKEADHDNG